MEFVKDLLQEFGIPYSSVGRGAGQHAAGVAEGLGDHEGVQLGHTGVDGEHTRTGTGHGCCSTSAPRPPLYSRKVVVLCESDTHAYSPFVGLETIDYTRDRPEDVGLALLLSLRDAGIIRVVT